MPQYNPETGLKQCACCGEHKSPDSFTKDRSTADGKDCYCRDCKAEKGKAIPRDKQQEYQNRWRARNRERLRKQARKRYAENPEYYREKARKWRQNNPRKRAKIRRKATLAQYDLTPEDFQTMLESQGGACALCGSDDPQHWSGRFQVDHDHDTGTVRGLLCAPCNGGLGLLNDDPALLRKAIDYLTKP